MKSSLYVLLLVGCLYGQVHGSVMNCSYNIVCSYGTFGPEYCNGCKIDFAVATNKSEPNEIKITNFLQNHSLPITKVEFFGGELDFIPREIYEMSPIVDIIYVRQFNTKVINQNFFGDAKHLRIFVSFNNSVKTLGPNSFETAPNLDKLLLTHSELEEIHSDAFKNLTKLTSLFIGDNKLEKIDPLWFQDLVKIEKFHAESNNIHKINAKDFMNADTLSFIKLGHNQIAKISQDAFKNLLKLTKIELHQNKCIDGDFNGPPTDKDYTTFDVLNMTALQHEIAVCA